MPSRPVIRAGLGWCAHRRCYARVFAVELLLPIAMQDQAVLLRDFPAICGVLFCDERTVPRKSWSLCATAGTMGTRPGAMAHDPEEDLMSEVINRLVVAMNAHDLDAAAGFNHEDYRSEKLAHPGRAFVGRAQMRANWVVDVRGGSRLPRRGCRSVQDGETTWYPTANWSGTLSDWQAFEMRG